MPKEESHLDAVSAPGGISNFPLDVVGLKAEQKPGVAFGICAGVAGSQCNCLSTAWSLSPCSVCLVEITLTHPKNYC